MPQCVVKLKSKKNCYIRFSSLSDALYIKTTSNMCQYIIFLKLLNFDITDIKCYFGTSTSVFIALSLCLLFN